MNILSFWLRIAVAALFVINGVSDLATKNRDSGLASLALAVVLLLPLLRLLYLSQKPLPLSSLKDSFSPQKTLSLLRSIWGLILAFSGLGLITKKESIGFGFLIIGLLLLSPLSDFVFTYDPAPPDPVTGHSQWNKKMTRLSLIRALGVILLLYSVEFYREHRYAGGHVFLIIGLLLVLIRQIRLLIERRFFKNE